MVWCMTDFLSVYLRANLRWKYSCQFYINEPKNIYV